MMETPSLDDSKEREFQEQRTAKIKKAEEDLDQITAVFDELVAELEDKGKGRVEGNNEFWRYRRHTADQSASVYENHFRDTPGIHVVKQGVSIQRVLDKEGDTRKVEEEEFETYSVSGRSDTNIPGRSFKYRRDIYQEVEGRRVSKDEAAHREVGIAVTYPWEEQAPIVGISPEPGVEQALSRLNQIKQEILADAGVN